MRSKPQITAFLCYTYPFTFYFMRPNVSSVQGLAIGPFTSRFWPLSPVSIVIPWKSILTDTAAELNRAIGNNRANVGYFGLCLLYILNVYALCPRHKSMVQWKVYPYGYRSAPIDNNRADVVSSGLRLLYFPILHVKNRLRLPCCSLYPDKYWWRRPKPWCEWGLTEAGGMECLIPQRSHKLLVNSENSLLCWM